MLLVRSKPVQPTEAGAAVVRFARQAALLQRDALTELGAEGAPVTSIPLAVNADSLATWLLPALARVCEQHPVVFAVQL
ncbi:ArgP/LysG family DNA-binding transcriptional regulator, partial [Rhizobium johnstonii]